MWLSSDAGKPVPLLDPGDQATSCLPRLSWLAAPLRTRRPAQCATIRFALAPDPHGTARAHRALCGGQDVRAGWTVPADRGPAAGRAATWPTHPAGACLFVVGGASVAFAAEVVYRKSSVQGTYRLGYKRNLSHAGGGLNRQCSSLGGSSAVRGAAELPFGDPLALRLPWQPRVAHHFVCGECIQGSASASCSVLRFP
jgi:hypothetical protein